LISRKRKRITGLSTDDPDYEYKLRVPMADSSTIILKIQIPCRFPPINGKNPYLSVPYLFPKIAQN